MARMIPTHLAPESRRPVATVHLHPFDEGYEESAPAVDHERPGGADEQPHGDEEHGPGHELERAHGDPQEVEDDQDQGEHVEHDGDHGLTVPSARPFDLAQLKEGLTRWVDGLSSLDDQAVGLHQVEEAAGALGEAKTELVDRLVDNLPVNERGHRVPWVETPVGILKKDRAGGYSSWDAEGVWPELLTEARQRVARANGGELTPEAEAGAAAMLAVLKEVISSPSFKVTALKNLGIDPDEVRSTTPSRTIVRFA